jgi:O-acetylhomoserine (thiol)-lyase
VYTPDPSYHGAVWTEAARPIGPVAYALRARVRLLRDLGPAVGLSGGMDHAGDLRPTPEPLGDRLRIAAVALDPQGNRRRAGAADRILRGGYGGLVGFELAAGRAAGRRFIDALSRGRVDRKAAHIADIGDVVEQLERVNEAAPGGAARCQLEPDVIHPSAQTGAARERADRILRGGYGGLVGFELAAGRAAGRCRRCAPARPRGARSRR